MLQQIPMPKDIIEKGGGYICNTFGNTHLGTWNYVSFFTKGFSCTSNSCDFPKKEYKV